MKKILIILLIFSFLFIIIFSLARFLQKQTTGIISPLGEGSVGREKEVLTKYSLPNLQKTIFTGSQIKLGRILKKEDKYTSYLFSYKSIFQNISISIIRFAKAQEVRC